jgi:UDP-glucose 4-epimerase
MCITDRSPGRADNLAGLDVELRVASGLDAATLDDVMCDADAVVHLAAVPSVPRSIENPMASHAANATGTLTVLEAARRAGAPHTIVASSSSVYGANPTLPKSEELATAPLSPYAVTKLATEHYTLVYGQCFDLPVLAFRFFNVFGPLQTAGHAYAAVIPTFIDRVLRGRPIPIHGDGKQTRDFTYVGSVAAVITRAVLGRTTCEGPVNLAFGSRRTLLDVVDELAEVFGRPLACDHGPPRPGDVRHSQADQSRLRTLLPDVQPVEFGEGLRQTVAWLRSLPEYDAASAPSMP